MKNIRYLYRYIPVSEKKYYENIFKKHLLYFSSPESFNDPFDCKTNLSYKNCTDNDIKLFFRRMVEISSSGTVISQLNKKVSDLFDKYKKDPERMINMMNQKLIEALKEAHAPMGVLCLSEIPDDILMLSHYTNGHRGIVLQFLKDGLIKRFSARACDHIEYSEDFPSVRDWNESDLSNFHKLFLLRKSKHWEYEKEWRVFTAPQNREDKPGDRNFDFPKEILTGVIIGCQIREEHKKEINGLMKKYCPQVKIFYSKKDDKSYKIIIEPQLPV
jgi:hypothetical protein